MKSVKIILITILCGLTVLLGVVLGWGIHSGRGFQRGFGRPYTLAKEYEMPASEIESLYIDYSMNSNDVYLYEGTGENIVIREYTNFGGKEEGLSTVEQEGNALVIKGKRRHSFFLFGFSRDDAYVEIYLPSGFLTETKILTTSGEISSEKDFTGGRSFLVESSSGDIRFPKVEAEKITASASSGSITFIHAAGTVVAQASSGDIFFQEITGDAEISTSSGEIKVERIDGGAECSASSGDVRIGCAEGDVSISTSSGEIAVLGGSGTRTISASSGSITLADVNGRFDLETTSGEISLENGNGYGEAEASSGDIDVRLSRLEGSLDINTTSGEVRIYIPQDASFSFAFSSASGECTTFFDDSLSYNRRGTSAKGDYGSSPDFDISIATSSGDATVGVSTRP